MLSIKCPSCGGTVQFDEQHIATFCSFCGSHLPDMTDYVKKVAELELEKKQHIIDMETMEKELKKERIKNSPEKSRLIALIIVTTPIFIIIFWLLTKLNR